jgi:hypothetical protein
MNHADLTMKVSDTLIANCVYRDAAGNPVNLTTAGITIRSCVRVSGKAGLSFPGGSRTAELEVVLEDQSVKPGEYRIRGDSTDWPAADIWWDVRYTKDGDSFSSKTVTIRMLPRIT